MQSEQNMAERRPFYLLTKSCKKLKACEQWRNALEVIQQSKILKHSLPNCPLFVLISWFFVHKPS